MAKVDKRVISDNLDVEVTHVDNGYTVACINKNVNAPLIIRVNFESSVNLTPAAVAGSSKLITPNVVELTVKPSSKSEAATLVAINPEDNYYYKYTCATQLKKVAGAASTAAATAASTAAPAVATTAATAQPATAAKAPASSAPTAAAAPARPAVKAAPPKAGSRAPPPEGIDETERKSLAEGLELLLHSINNGYYLQFENKSESAYTVTLDLSASENLTLTAEGATTMEGMKVSTSVPPHSIVNCANLPVNDWDLGSCEIRYKASIRKQ